MADRFDLLIEDLRRLRAPGVALGVFGEESYSYHLNPVSSEDRVREFEAQNSGRLPDDYRQFIMRVGNGGAGPDYGLFPMGEMDDGFGFGPWGSFVGVLFAPFPHTRAWNDLAGVPEDPEDGADEEFDALMDAFEERYWDPQQLDGAIPICHLGCTLRQWLAITGPEAGTVWCDNRTDYDGISPLQANGRHRVSFFEWYRDWVDEALSKLEAWEKRRSG
jgi:hypothetical protein